MSKQVLLSRMGTLIRTGQELARNWQSSRRGRQVAYIGEQSDWVIGAIGESLVQALPVDRRGLQLRLCQTTRGLRGQVVHFGSLWALASHIGHTHHSNRLAATIYHGDFGISPGLDGALEVLLAHLPRLERVVVSCALMEQRMLRWGFAHEQVCRIPLGVDTSLFVPTPAAERQAFRARLGIPAQALCIGSFQKDGTGWGDGTQPKLIKGPDVFVEAVRQLAREFPVQVLLTGPARGYVRQELELAGVPYVHRYLEDLRDLPRWYGALDLYLVTSREEGGPLAVLESLACGVPLVSTCVGMAPDVIQSGVNGLLAAVDDISALVNGARRMLSDRQLARRLAEAGRQTALEYDWRLVAARLAREVYQPLLGE